jgi:hypothetical protein
MFLTRFKKIRDGCRSKFLRIKAFFAKNSLAILPAISALDARAANYLKALVSPQGESSLDRL